MLVRRPMVGIALSTAAGMLIASSGLLSAGFLFSAAGFVLILSIMFFRTEKSVPLIFILVGLIGACRFLVGQPGLAADSIEKQGAGFVEREISVFGKIAGSPRYYAYLDSEDGTWTFPLTCQEISASSRWKTASGKIDVQLHAAPLDIKLEPGDLLKLDGGFNRKDFPGRNRYEIDVDAGEWKLVKPASIWSPLKWGRAWRKAMEPRLEAGLDNYPEQEAILKALVLGLREEIPDETTAVFKRTGSFHIFAISGLHVGIVGFLLAAVLKMLSIPRGKFGLVLIPVLALYVISTGMKSSALRALLMAAVFLLGPLFRRKPDIPTSVSVAAILLLYFQPLELVSPGFIFSFAVVSFLVMAFSAVPRSWIQGAWIKAYSSSLLITSVAAGAVAIPLSALFFGQLSPIALVGNLVVVPLTFCVVLSGWLSVLLPPVSTVFNSAAVLFIDLLLGSVRFLDALPGSSWAVEPPSLFSVLLWLGCLIAFFAGCTSRSGRLFALGGAFFAALLGLLS